MSTDPVGLGETAITATKEGWCNVEVIKEMYCSYRGDCPLHRVVQDIEICLWCRWRAPIDMPVLIKEKLKDGKV